MTTEVSDAEDPPYPGRELPLPPAWLPNAAEAVAAGRLLPTWEGAKRAGEPPPKPSEPPEPPAEPPAEVAADFATVPELVGVSADPDTIGLTPSPPPIVYESADDTGWQFVPLGISDPEVAATAADAPAAEPSGGVATLAPPEVEPGVGLPGQNWFEEERRRPWLLLVAGGVLVLALVVLVVAFLASGSEKHTGGTSQPPASAAPPADTVPPGAAVGARPVPPEQLPALAPQAVAVGVFDGQLQVTWDPPREPDAVSGYFVVAQSPDGAVQERRLIARDANLSVVFGEDAQCAVVTTVVSTPAGLQLARGDLVCASPAASGAPGSADGSDTSEN